MTLFAPFPDDRFEVIYADPPWRFPGGKGSRDQRRGKSAVDHYPVVSFSDLACLPVADISASDGVLCCWLVQSELPDCIAVCEAWGFRWSTVVGVAQAAAESRALHAPDRRDVRHLQPRQTEPSGERIVQRAPVHLDAPHRTQRQTGCCQAEHPAIVADGRENRTVRPHSASRVGGLGRRSQCRAVIAACGARDAAVSCVGCGDEKAIDRSNAIPAYPGALCYLCWRGHVWGVVSPPEHAQRQRDHQRRETT